MLWLAGLLVVLNILYQPPSIPRKYNLKEGDIATRDIIAPYDFEIMKTDEELEQARNEIAYRIPKVFDYDVVALESLKVSLNNLNAIFDSLGKTNLSDESRLRAIQLDFPISASLFRFLGNRYQRTKTINEAITIYSRLMFKGLLEKKPAAGSRIIMIDMRGREILESLDNLYDSADLESLIARRTPEFRDLIRDFFRPNLILNESKTENKIEIILASIPKSKGRILKGERIIEAHRRVDREALEKVRALEKTYTLLGLIAWLRIFLGRNLLYILLVFFFFRYDTIKRHQVLEKTNFYFLIFNVCLFLLVVKGISLFTRSFYLYPIAFSTFLISLFLGLDAALIFATALASTLAFIRSDMTLFYFLIISGLGAASLKMIMKSRMDFYLISLIIAVVNIMAVALIHLYFRPDSRLLPNVAEAFLNGFISGFSVFFVLPFFERVFNVTTDFTLLELGNLNLPIFKEMALTAAGTYHHSIMVGNLAEAGANAIGANPLLARVAAYYHDVGKLKKPGYFIENQMEKTNPHDQLTPQVSALVILSHVKEGADLAKKLGLPQIILDIIQQHHGSTTIETFYRKALHRAQVQSPTQNSAILDQGRRRLKRP